MASAASTYVVAYAIVSDERRLALARVLEAAGHRVQYSVFEVVATADQMRALLLRATAPSCCDPAVDSLRCYRLCGDCQPEAIVRGRGPGVLRAGRALVI